MLVFNTIWFYCPLNFLWLVQYLDGCGSISSKPHHAWCMHKRPKGFGASRRGKRREHFVEFGIMQYGIGAMGERSLPSSQQELSRSQSIWWLLKVIFWVRMSSETLVQAINRFGGAVVILLLLTWNSGVLGKQLGQKRCESQSSWAPLMLQWGMRKRTMGAFLMPHQSSLCKLHHCLEKNMWTWMCYCKY